MNKRERDLRKAAEECSELATILIQQLNKPHKDFSEKIEEEMGDVLFRLENLKKHFDFPTIVDRIKYKRNKENEKNEHNSVNAS